ncbi:5-hydroxytryptamine receptor 4 [Patella vulgata]|uniref:5-hydroxytryptamine receptor 4 n=1 Tax=Patella vulgata TaxID=6465 RepID=UPI00217FFEA7|nr:5-hydroxytryptamine receptor 4 [Patella vulgata]XP_050397573.1 5-hydroxytryptamine receptor 4 [Patella vulgata]
MSNLSCDVILADKAGPPPFYSAAVRYVIGAILMFVPITTIVGNGIVITAFATHRRLRNITNSFVVSLAIADIGVAVIVMPFSIYQQLNNKAWALGYSMCIVVTSFDVMLCTISIFHLSCLAIDRYLAICRPFLHERMTKNIVMMMLITCWVFPVSISFIPIMNEWNLIGIEDYYKCLFPDGAQMCVFVVNIAFAIVCSAVAFYVPVVFMIICNIKIYMAARRQAMQIRSLDVVGNSKGKGKFKQETKAAKTLGIIMGCFSVCWFPFFIFNVIDPLIGYKIPYNIWIVALWLGYINSMMNPFLYYYFNRSFKAAFKRIFRCRICKGFSEYEDDYVSGVTTGSE